MSVPSASERGRYIVLNHNSALPSQASITRSSQPMVGLKNSRSTQDEKLIESIFQTHLSPETAYSPIVDAAKASPANVYGATATNLIIDARPTTNAMANSVKGAGTENMEHYKGGKKVYLGIDNIHVRLPNSLYSLATAHTHRNRSCETRSRAWSRLCASQRRQARPTASRLRPSIVRPFEDRAG